MRGLALPGDAHKRTHTPVVLDAVTGVSRGETTVQSSDDGALNALRFAAGLDSDRVWSVEDCRHVTATLERALLGAGERVIRVPPRLTGESRKAIRTPGKSDPIDARAWLTAEGCSQLGQVRHADCASVTYPSSFLPAFSSSSVARRIAASCSSSTRPDSRCHATS